MLNIVYCLCYCMLTSGRNTMPAHGLWEGCDYYFRVAAENEAGLSDYTTLDKPVTAKLPFCE